MSTTAPTPTRSQVLDVQNAYSDPLVSTIEEKFTLIPVETTTSQLTFIGKYPLEPFKEGMRGTYGGEFVSQGILAAWETIQSTDYSPHSIHCYFLKAGSHDSPIKWIIEVTSEGRNYCNRLVRGYQSHTNQLVFMLTASFSKNNHIKQRKLNYNQQPQSPQIKEKVPFEFQRSPHFFLNKYRDKLDDMSYFEHTHGTLQHILPPEYFKVLSLDTDSQKDVGMRDFGVFVKVLDDLSKAKNQLKTKVIDLAYASDSFYLSTIPRALGLSLSEQNMQFFRVSLDHSIWFHDTDYDPTEWMFLDYRFSRMSNDRVLCQCQFFTLDGRMVASLSQEALIFIPKSLADEAKGGSYKL